MLVYLPAKLREGVRGPAQPCGEHSSCAPMRPVARTRWGGGGGLGVVHRAVATGSVLVRLGERQKTGSEDDAGAAGDTKNWKQS